MLIFFGMLIGVLTAVNETTGLTATLVGLLFALIGGSLVGWYRGVASAEQGPNGRLTPSQVKGVAKGAGTIALGGLIGLLLGFGLKTLDLFLIRPNVPLTRQERAIDELSEKLGDIETRLATSPENQTRSVDADLRQLTVEARRLLNQIPANLSPSPDAFKTAVVPAKSAVVPVAVKTQSASISELRSLAERLNNEGASRGGAEGERLKGLSKSIYGLTDSLDLLTPDDRKRLPEIIRVDLDRIFRPK
jgi:hypothetical protein